MKKLFMILALMSATMVHASKPEIDDNYVKAVMSHYQSMPHFLGGDTFIADGVEITLDYNNLATIPAINQARESHKKYLKEWAAMDESLIEDPSTQQYKRNNIALCTLYLMIDAKIKPLKCELKHGTSKATLEKHFEFLERDSMDAQHYYMDAVMNQSEEDFMFKRLVVKHKCMMLVSNMLKTLN